MRCEHRDPLCYELLVRRFNAGDNSAVTELFALFNTRLLFYLRRLLADEPRSWDALQETWVTVIRKMHTVHDARRLPAWLYTVARRAALARDADRQLIASLDAMEHPVYPGPAVEIDTDDADAVRYAIDQLTPAHREVITLYFLQDLSLAEMAALTGASVGTIKSRLHYAKSRIRVILLAQGVDHA